MKAEIRASGVLKISCETELEAYAFRKWKNNNIYIQTVLWIWRMYYLTLVLRVTQMNPKG